MKSEVLTQLSLSSSLSLDQNYKVLNKPLIQMLPKAFHKLIKQDKKNRKDFLIGGSRSRRETSWPAPHGTSRNHLPQEVDA
ncbi:hypothetical protein TNCV_1664691 [Trichonephila clavipes]|uniref:Uncharacterized protein n=1 Tax=Trichonephila clavipes TaxID=2585209 RepID=A0A8X6RX56_TRICX|nr:hypothetical protein TNCV_1664691 [Trichonephila clavipes]